MVEEQTGLASIVEIPDSIYSAAINKGGFSRGFLLQRKTDLHELRDMP